MSFLICICVAFVIYSKPFYFAVKMYFTLQLSSKKKKKILLKILTENYVIGIKISYLCNVYKNKMHILSAKLDFKWFCTVIYTFFFIYLNLYSIKLLMSRSWHKFSQYKKKKRNKQKIEMDFRILFFVFVEIFKKSFRINSIVHPFRGSIDFQFEASFSSTFHFT